MESFAKQYNRIAMIGVVYAVSDVLDIRVNDILSKRRRWDILEARQLCLFIISKAMPHISQEEAGKVFRIGHSTVAHAIDKIDDMLIMNDRVIWEKHQKCISILNNHQP